MARPWRRSARETPVSHQRRGSVSARILGLMLTLMVCALVVSGSLTFALQLRGLNDRVQEELHQEVEALATLNEGRPEEGIPPYTDVDQLLLDFMRSNATGPTESIVALIDGDVAYETVPTIDGVDLGAPASVQHIRDVTRPGEAVYTTTVQGGVELRMVVVSVQAEGSPVTGTLAVGIDLGRQRAQIVTSMATYGAVSIGAIGLAGVAGWLLTRRLMRPLADLRSATAEIDTSDLTRRVDVADPDNDVAQLAMNFNQMLDRLEAGFADQRQFLDDAAHELRTPLTIVRGNLEIMSTTDAEDVEQTRALVLDETDRMERLVGDLLLLAKRARPDFLKLGPVPVEELAEEAFARIRLLGDRDWRLDCTVGPDDVVEADRHRLIQAVVQLSANAVRYSGDGDPVILRVDRGAPTAQVLEQVGELPELPVRATPSGYAAAPRAATMLRIAVEDSGAGIEPEDLERIFDRFGRVEGPGASSEGLGLGLTIVQAIAQAHGGAVTVVSEPGRGSTFQLWIPGRGTR